MDQDVISRLREFKYQGKQNLKYLRELNLDALKQRHLKKLTILHSNDLHGDFLAEEVDSGLVGGVSMLSGYISKVRNEEKNVIYAIAGDMLRGSIIDSEYKGLSTIEVMNLLTPDVATIGNHEVDYGLAHLLFIEKCANFPIINANMYLVSNGTRLFSPHFIIKIDGIKILFIGVLTEEVLASARQEELIGKMIDVRAEADEIRKVVDAYRTHDIDLTILLTHIGFEEDKRLAAELAHDYAIDMIIGGHTHTYLEEPCVVEGIPIVQAAVGTAQIGRFDILFDEFHNRIDSYTWELIPITEDRCPRDEALEELINSLKKTTDAKYGRILTRLPCTYTHPVRNRETDLGDLLAEGMRAQLEVDLALLGSGSIRGEKLGPIVTLQDLLEVYPYENPMIGFHMTGGQLRRAVKFLMRDEAIIQGDHCENFQFSKGFFCEYDCSTHSILQLKMNGKEVRDEDVFMVTEERYYYNYMKESLNIPLDEIEKNGPPVQLAMSAANVLEEYMMSQEFIKLDGEPRLIIHTDNCQNS
ncbi:MAG: bifunctional metallophosphatase/5'-nucleotidase [Mogibacterium sp.]|nr:bifunctional metallophosphatase/5'-nucleotidase [Mogibacterium sp.]